MTAGRLATIPFFKEPGIELSTYETRCHWRRFDENEVLVDYDDISTDVYFLASGEVRILNRSQSGKEVILGEMRGGEDEIVDLAVGRGGDHQIGRAHV